MDEENSNLVLPKECDLEVFAQNEIIKLQNLSFDAKRSIITNVLDKVISTENELKVYGFLPINELNYVNFSRINWNRGPPKRR